MLIAVKSEQEQVIKDMIASGAYSTAEDVVAAALDFIRSDPIDSLPLPEREELRGLLAIGASQLDRGQSSDFTAEDIIREGRSRLSKKAAE